MRELPKNLQSILDKGREVSSGDYGLRSRLSDVGERQMNFNIIKAENGWILHRTYTNQAVTKDYVFSSLKELAEWIIVNFDDTTA